MPEEIKDKSTIELIGVLQAISVVARNLANRLMKLDEEVKRREKENCVCGQSCQRQSAAKS